MYPALEQLLNPHSYNFTDSDVQAGSYKYRLKQVDLDGTYEYSDEIEVEVIALSEFTLEQNYPNPFNPSTSISYSISEIEFVTLKVYDVLGNEITTLVDEEKPIGIYDVIFDATRLPSGVYFYRLQAGDFVETKKMVLMK